MWPQAGRGAGRGERGLKAELHRGRGRGQGLAGRVGGGSGGREGQPGVVSPEARQLGGLGDSPPSGVPGIQRACLPRCPPLFCRIKTRSSPRLNFFPQIRQIQTSKTVDGESHQGKCSLGPSGGGALFKNGN